MALQSPDALLDRLRKGARGGVFFLFGDEDYLKEEAAAAIVEAHLEPGTRDFNLDQLRGGDVDPETLASILQTPPMMAPFRVVVVRDAQGLAVSARTRDVIESLLERDLPDLAVVLVAELPARSKARFYETLKKKATAAEFQSLSLNDVPGWLMDRARVDGLELEPDAARALPAAVGRDLRTLVGELTKLRDFVGERGAITRADVEAAVGVVPREDRWAWFDRVADGDIAGARRSLPVLLEGSESGVGLVIGLGTHFLRLGLALSGGERSLSGELPPHQRWLARRIVQQARGWTLERVDAALDDLLRADRLLKSTGLGDQPILEELLLRMQARLPSAA